MIRNILNWIISVFTRPTPVPVPPQPTGDFVTDLLNLHNNHRQSLGLNPLKLNNLLVRAAQSHSDWMSQHGNLDHNEGVVDPGDRLIKVGYDWSIYGENIAMGYHDPNTLFAGWLKSPGHRQNIEDSVFVEVGFGFSGTYWTADFATHR